MEGNSEPLKNKTDNLSVRFGETLVLDTETNKNILFKNIWEESDKEYDVVLIHFFRRFG